MPQYLSRCNSSGLCKADRQVRRRAYDRERRIDQENMMAEARAAIASKVPLAAPRPRPEKFIPESRVTTRAAKQEDAGKRKKR